MKKLDLKPVFKVLTGLIVIAVVGLLVFSLTIDGLVKRSIENTGSELMNTSVEVDDVSISVLDGSGTIDGIAIQNPDGFSEESALLLKKISMKVNISTLLADTVIVEELIINEPELFFEQRADGNNFNKLTENMDATDSGQTNMIIDRLLVNDGFVRVSSDVGEERSAETSFSEIELTGVGRQGNNTMEQVMEQVLRPVIQKAAQEAVKEGLLDQAKEKLQDVLNE